MNPQARKPAQTLRLGISACYFHADPLRPVFKGKTLFYLEQSLVHWVQSSGAVTYLIPPVAQAAGGFPTASLESYVNDLDGLVLHGGADVSPKSYGEEPLRPEWGGDYVRDCYEISLVQHFLKAGKPILGICRGAQLLNVALGGTLYQDITLQLPGSLVHRNWDIYDKNIHEIEFAKNSNLSQFYNGNVKVNSIHHQGIKILGRELVAEARSLPDGIVEAIRYQGNSYAFAVQWHPEFQVPEFHPAHDRALYENLADGRPILEEFLAAVKKKKGDASL
jgi:putative glutamine amidotransferase